MAACSTGAASADGAASRPVNPRRFARAASRLDESRGSAALDSLAGSLDLESACRGQFLLPGLPVYFAADSGAPLAASRPRLAAVVAEQVARRGAAGVVLVGLRGLQFMGQPLVDGLDCSGLLCRGLRHRRLLSRSRVLQIRLSYRSVQLRAVAGVASGSEGRE